MTQEEKARAYDQAIINGSRLWECGLISRESYEYMFPELKEKESENDRIRQDTNIYTGSVFVWDEKKVNEIMQDIVNFTKQHNNNVTWKHL